MADAAVGAETIIDVRGVGKAFPGGAGATLAIEDITFEQRRGEFLALVGPSGCGKTTLLRCLSGLLTPSSGELRFHGEPVRTVPEGLAIVFQEYTRSLYPWLSVERNVEFGVRGATRAQRRDRVRHALAEVGLGEFAHHFPWQLSGGMQQRVAIARAVAMRPQVLLMDEPFASVDAQTRVSLETMVLDLWREHRWTVTLVTHDIDEAVFMADRVLVLSPRPSVVREEVAIDLPRPRDQIETRALPEFQEHRRRIFKLIEDTH